jgi:hypothetical protein
MYLFLLCFLSCRVRVWSLDHDIVVDEDDSADEDLADRGVVDLVVLVDEDLADEGQEEDDNNDR